MALLGTGLGAQQQSLFGGGDGAAGPNLDSPAQVLDAAERAGDPDVVAPAVDLLLADPSLTPQGAVDMVLAARKAAEDARRRAAVAEEDGPRQLGIPRPLCPVGEFEKAVAGLKAALAVLSTYRLGEYQRGSVLLLLEGALELLSGMK